MPSYSLITDSMKREFRQLRLSQLDRILEVARNLPPRPSQGWIASVREALGLSQKQVGTMMQATGQAIQQFEQAEAENRITLRALRRVAGTMGCDVVYADDGARKSETGEPEQTSRGRSTAAFEST